MTSVATLAPYIGGARTSNRLLATWAGRWFDCAKDWRGTGRTPHTRILHPDGAAALFSADTWDTASITNSAGTVFLVAANGADPPIRFDGHRLNPARCTLAFDYEAASPPPFQADRLRFVTTFHNRVWWAERTGRQLWYGDLHSPGGGLYPFFIDAPAEDDSDIAALSTLTRDGGDGPEEYLVILFRSGTALVYEGIDPNNIDGFRLRTRFFVGEPLGRSPLVPYGGDLIAVTRRGVIPVSAVLAGRGIQRSDFHTDVIRGAWDEVVRQFADRAEWGGFAHPNGAFLFFNIPDFTGAEWPHPGRQYALNAVTGAWCEFLGIPAAGWATFEERAFFSHHEDPTICEWGEQFTTDDGRPIPVEYRGAWTYMPNPAQLGVSQGAEGVFKRVNSVIPQMKGMGGLSELEVGMISDFRAYDPHRILWSTLRVPNGLAPRRRITVLGRGHAVAPVIRSIPGSDLQAPFEFFSLLFDVTYGGRI